MQVTVMSKPGCHLCETVIRALATLCSKHDLEIQERNIMQDEKLYDEYWLRIPVVMLDGRVVYEARDIGRPSDCTAQLERALFP